MAASLPSGFRTITRAVVSDAASLDAAGWLELEATVVLALADRPPRMRRQLAMFATVLDVLALVRYGRTIRTLDAARCRLLLERLEQSPILLARRGVWGVRTMAMLGYYARPGAAAGIGYRASSAGWSARR